MGLPGETGPKSQGSRCKGRNHPGKAGAIAGKSEYLVTGDKHLLSNGHFGEVKIVTPADFDKIQTKQEQRR